MSTVLNRAKGKKTPKTLLCAWRNAQSISWETIGPGNGNSKKWDGWVPGWTDARRIVLSSPCVLLMYMQQQLDFAPVHYPHVHEGYFQCKKDIQRSHVWYSAHGAVSSLMPAWLNKIRIHLVAKFDISLQGLFLAGMMVEKKRDTWERCGG